MFKKAIGMNAVNEAEDMGHRTMFKKMIGMEPPSPSDPSHVARAAQVYQDQSETGKGEMMRQAVRQEVCASGLLPASAAAVRPSQSLSLPT